LEKIPKISLAHLEKLTDIKCEKTGQQKEYDYKYIRHWGSEISGKFSFKYGAYISDCFSLTHISSDFVGCFERNSGSALSLLLKRAFFNGISCSMAD
jgi:hypothetical protein